MTEDLTAYRKIRKLVPPPGGPHRDRRREVRERAAEEEVNDFWTYWGLEKTLEYMRSRKW